MLSAAGEILYLTFQDLAPQAKLDRHWAPPLGAVAGFLLGLIGDQLLHWPQFCCQVGSNRNGVPEARISNFPAIGFSLRLLAAMSVSELINNSVVKANVP